MRTHDLPTPPLDRDLRADTKDLSVRVMDVGLSTAVRVPEDQDVTGDHRSAPLNLIGIRRRVGLPRPPARDESTLEQRTRKLRAGSRHASFFRLEPFTCSVEEQEREIWSAQP
jgi:hypothetical protein